MKHTEKNLTVGSVPHNLIRFALPLLGANLLQSFYSVVDMVVVGRIVGKAGLAAISNASMISFIINSICIGMTMGGTVLIAQYKGADDEQGQKETAGTLLTLSLLASLLITSAGLLTYSPLFRLLHVPAEAMEDACGYMQIICFGTVFIFGYNAVCSLLKGFGDSKSPLCFVAVAAVLNIFLDLLFVGPMGMGTNGAACATVISQGGSFIVALVHLKRKNLVFDFQLKNFMIQKNKMAAILKIGLPTAVQMVVVNISYLIITGMLNHFGVSVAAASGIGLKVNTLAGMPCWAIGQAVTVMAGQNMGAGKPDRVKDATKCGLWMNLAVTFVVMIVVQLFCESIIRLFHPADTDVIIHGVMYLRICCSLNSLIYAVMYTLDSFAIGIGSANIAMCNALLDAVAVRLPVSWLLAFPVQLGFAGVCLGQALSPILPAIVGFLYFRHTSCDMPSADMV